MRRGFLLVIAVTVAAAAWPSAASAATAREDEFDPDYGSCKADCPPPTFEVVLVASPGERNDVTATRDPSGAVVLHDAGAPITTKHGCKAIDPNTVSCGAEYSLLRVTVRDGDDVVRILDGFARVEGGAGNDQLTGGPASDTLVGGPGNDELHGGAGDDRLMDGVKRIRRGAASNNDSFDGGEGTDWVDYSGRLFPVAIDLRPGATVGQSGEHDTFSAIENAMGGTAGDRITGDDAKNELDGGTGAGADLVKGGGDADTVWTGPGDRTFGGQGPDWIRTSTARYFPLPGSTLQRVNCGAGVDVIEGASLHTLVGDSCEVASALGDQIRHHLPLTSFDAPVLTYEQYRDTPMGYWTPDNEHIEVRASGVAAHKRHPRRGTLLAAGDTGYAEKFDLHLSGAGAALLRRYGRIRARVTTRNGYMGYMIDLRAPASASP